MESSARPRLPWWKSETALHFWALLACVLIVQAAYSFVITPKADALMAENIIGAELAKKENKPFIPTRSLFIILKDPEQQACFVLTFWATFLLWDKLRRAKQEAESGELALVEVEAGERIRPGDALAYAKNAEQLAVMRPGALESLNYRATRAALRRFHATGSVQEASDAAQEQTDAEGDRMDTDLSLIRYIAWAIPSIGFIGTVRGIGDALAQADNAIKGDLSGVTDSLGVAFNSTLIALFISLYLMYFIHMLQKRQEALVLDTKARVRENVTAVLQAPGVGN